MDRPRGIVSPWPLIVVVLAVFFIGCIEEGEIDNQSNSQEPTEPVEPRFEAHFTEPAPGQPDDTISALIIEYLEDAPEGSTVRAALYTISLESVAQAFIDARQRGVDVEMVLGNTNRTASGADWTAVALLREELGDSLTICSDGESSGGCIGDNIHHNKFVTFSELGDHANHVVLQSSGNLTDFQQTQYDNVLVVYDDKPLYDAYHSYWDDLRRQQADPSYDRTESGASPTTAYFSPYTLGDPIHEELTRVNCAQGGEVYLAMAFFTNARYQIAERLAELDQEGCEVHVLLRASEIASPGSGIINNIRQGDIDFGYFPSAEEIQMHSKYLVYRAGLDQEEDPAFVVWTGSHNYTRAALLNNDEVLLRIEDEDLFERYRDNWVWMRERAETRHP